MNKHLTYIVGWVGVMAFGWGCSSDSGGSAIPDPGFTCQAGQLKCGESCVFVESDPANCGTCGAACPTGTSCVASVCSCQSGLESCGGACVDTSSDPANCGTCTHACEPGLVCSIGACSATCQVGLSQCGGACVDLQASLLHCGLCGNACPGGRTCTSGSCACQAGTDCGGSCVDTQNDPANCGFCGNVCTGGAACIAGGCTGGTTGTGGATGTTSTGGTTSATGTGGTTSTGGTGTGGEQATGGTSSGGTGGAATGGTSGDTGGTAGAAGDGGGEPLECATEPNPGEGGVVIDGCCAVLCTYDDLTDEDGDGWGFELQAECVVAASEAATGQDSCLPDPRTDLPEPGTGYWFPEVGDTGEPACVRACDDPESDVDSEGNTDGWGWEHQGPCIVPGSRPAAEGIPCIPEAVACTGNGYVICMDDDEDSSTPCVDHCIPPCQYGSLTDVDSECVEDGDGWGWEMGAACLVSGSSGAPQDLCCEVPARTGLPEAGSGYMADTDDSGVFGDSDDEVCMPPCSTSVEYDDSCTHWGYEGGLNCIDPDGIAAAQTVPCVYEALTTDPPTGDGWLENFTATFFGEANCQSLGADDPTNTNISQSACVGRGAVQLSGDNQDWFGAPGDLSAIWEGATCVCGGSEPCIPSCNDQQTCARCFEVACNPGGTYYHPDDENHDTHNGLCRTDQSAVIQVIDACPHNHQYNTYWCTEQRPDHIDISCSAFTAITSGRQDIDNIGSINVWVRPVDCSAGLGIHELTH